MEKPVPSRGTRSKTGCFPCRRRKKKCDETYPICYGCKWNALRCQWPQHNAPTQRRQRCQYLSPECHATDTHPPFLLVHPNVPNPLYIQWPSTESHANRFLFHFIHVTSKMLSVNSKGRRTHFIHHVSSVATSNALVMNCVLALGAAHLSACEGKNKRFKDRSRRYYGIAIAKLQETLKDTVGLSPQGQEIFGTPPVHQVQPVSTTNDASSLQNDDTLLAVMLLCFYEVSYYLQSINGAEQHL